MPLIISASKHVLQRFCQNPARIGNFSLMCDEVGLSEDQKKKVFDFLYRSKYVQPLSQDPYANLLVTEQGYKFLNSSLNSAKEKDMINNRSSWWPLYSQIKFLGKNEGTTKDARIWVFFFAFLVLSFLAYFFIIKS
ncbi:hypothetical protein [Pedobacter sp. N23S346]|uniref:hypothetical protein n=1 Tax=Pedobacter sp. N23S346 TaxID=3402750 RepID=UPI003AC178F6